MPRSQCSYRVLPSPLRLLCFSGLLLLSVRLTISQAQITLDGSLGRAGALTGPNYSIPAEVGQLRGPNLFHSFGQFNVRSGESATFSGPDTVANILGRVTGGTSSTINGLLRSQIPRANLYLINPSGVVFGPDASLDISGSFHISTADYLRLADGARFSARLSDTTTLSVAPPVAFGFLGPMPAPIMVLRSSLDVPPGEALSLVGGDLRIVGDPVLTAANTPTLRARGGRVNLASVASTGEVGLAPADQTPALRVEALARLGSIEITQAAISATGNGSGTVTIRGGRLTVDGSLITASALGDVDGAKTGVDINVAEDVSVTNGAMIGTNTLGAGRAGDIRLTAARLTLTGGAAIGSITTAAGPGGSVTVTATDVITIAGSNSSGTLSGIISVTQGRGDAGRLAITAPTLTLDGGVLTAATLGEGKAGDVTVQAGRLTLTGGALIDSSTGGAGSGGSVAITATDAVTIAGSNSSGTPSGIISVTQGRGDAGHLVITAPTLTLDGGAITARALEGSEGKAGDVTVQVGRLTLTGGALIDSSTFGPGLGGSVTIAATDAISISNLGVISSDARGTGERSGNAGKVSIFTPVLNIQKAVIETRTIGNGNAGDVEIAVGRLTLTDGAVIDSFSGEVDTAGNLTVGTGRPGMVRVTATDSIFLSGRGSPSLLGSGIFTLTGGGAGETITVTTPRLTMDDGARIGADTGGDKSAGDVVVKAGNVSLSGGAQITSGSGVTTPIPSGSGVPVMKNFVGAGSGGTVTVTATDTVAISGSNSGLATSTAGTGRGGDITLQARQVQLSDGAVIAAESTSESSGAGNAGNVTLTAGDTFLSTNSRVTTLATQADGGNIQLTAPAFVRLRDSAITANVGGGRSTVGGNITIDPQFVLLQNSQIVAQAGEGHGGNIRLTAQQVILADPSSTVSASSASGIKELQGFVAVQAPVTSISGSIAPLPQSYARAAELLRDRCADRLRGGSVSRFVLGGRDGVPQEPGGLWPSLLLQEIQTNAVAPGGDLHGQATVSAEVLVIDHAGQPQVRQWPVEAEPWALDCARWEGKQDRTVQQ